MGRQYFDDGSWIDTDDSGTTYASNTLGQLVSKVQADGDFFRAPGYWTDARETSKLDAFVAAPNGDNRPWWDRVAEYGLTRAIDNHFGPAQSNKTSQPPTFAGQNGRTYSQVGTPLQQQGAMGGWVLPALAVAAVAFFAFR